MPKVPELQIRVENAVRKREMQMEMHARERAYKQARTHAPWDDGHSVGIVGDLQQLVQIAHNLLKRIGHEVQCSVSKDD